MTLTTTVTRSRFEGDGSSRRFPVDFVFFDPDDLVVVERRTVDGLETPCLRGVHYAVEGGGGGTGAVIAAIAPAAGVEWHVRRRSARVQGTDYQENDAFSAGAHEAALDRLQAQLQEIGDEQDRGLRLSPTADSLDPLPAPQAGAFLRARIDGEGLEWVHFAETGGVTVTPFMATLLDDPSKEAAWATLGLAAGSGTVTSVNVAPAPGGAAGMIFSGGPVTGSGTISAALAIQNLPEETAPNAAEDLVAVYSAAGAQHRRVRIANLPAPLVGDGSVTTAKLADSAVTAAKLADGVAVRTAANATSGGGQVYYDRQGDTIRFRRIVVAKTISGSGTFNALSDASLSVATSGDTITITLNVTRTYIEPGGGGGGGGG